MATCALPARGDVRLPALFSDHMVLQADKPANVWGWAEPKEEVVVTLAGVTRLTRADDDGRWQVKLDKFAANGQPQTLTVRGRNTLTVNDVLIGEVWLCSGQSNMAMQLKGLHGQVDNADQEIAAANHPQIRMFLHSEVYNIYELAVPPEEPLADRPGRWIVCAPETAAQFCAIGYYFARDLQRELKVPVGIVVSAVGGTPIEAWTGAHVQQKVAELQPLLSDWEKRLAGYDAPREQQAFLQAKQAWLKQRAVAVAEKLPVSKSPTPFKNLAVMKPAGLFNGMIAPLAPYTVRGVLWYQGERNGAGPFTGLYGIQLRMLVNHWRALWGDEMYFAWMQLPRYQKLQKLPVEPNGWGVAVRDGMRRALDLPRTGMAISIDLGGPTDGHPTNKADFARRFSRLALHDVYGKPDEEWTGPIYREFERQGQNIVISFYPATRLKASGDQLRGFAIAGEDRKFVWAEAVFAGNRVLVFSDKVRQPVAVRYGWAGNPDCNLTNRAGLPASPFRTDDWE